MNEQDKTRRIRKKDVWSVHDFCTNTLRRSSNLKSALNDIVRYIASKLNAEICSIYLVDKSNSTLVLEANFGLSTENGPEIKMNFNEGLVGLVAESKMPQEVYDPAEHPRFKKFQFLDEEKLKTFFGFPIMLGDILFGVLVIQTQKKSKGNNVKLMDLPTVAQAIAEAISTARLTDTQIYQSPKENITEEQAHKRSYFLKGKGASIGISIGFAHLQNHDIYRLKLSRDEFRTFDEEAARLMQAIQQAKKELEEAEAKARKDLGSEVSAIFQTHIELLDEELIEEFKDKIHENIAAGPAIDIILDIYQKKFKDSNNPYLQEREHDIIDIKNRLLNALYQEGQSWVSSSGEKQNNIILVAEQLLPTDVIQANANNIKGFIQTSGGITSHAAILANSLGIPMISGIASSQEHIHEGDFLIMDADSGVVQINPDTLILNKYYEILNIKEMRKKERESEAKNTDAKFFTKDKKPVQLLANIGLFAEAKLAKDMGCNGVGLYRTEFPFLAGDVMPSEADQYDLYKRTIEIMDGAPVTIRTLDLGGDKFPKFYKLPVEKNPFLGYRSIRVSLGMVDEFKKQLKAIFRAACFGPVKLMIPMISNVEEVIKTKAIIEEVKKELANEKKEFNPNVPFGIMVEVPSVAIAIELFLTHVDFVSIGTNDLIQYTLAVDRNNAHVSYNFQTMHPAILHLLKNVSLKCKAKKKEVSICGEMAGNPLYAPVLIGLGIHNLSMTPKSIPTINNIVSNISSSACRKLADMALKKSTNEEVKRYLLEEIGHII